MMCSSWKISVFGIVALMLAFGLIDAQSTRTTCKAPRRCDHWSRGE